MVSCSKMITVDLGITNLVCEQQLAIEIYLNE